MENMILTQLSVPEVRKIVREELETVLQQQLLKPQKEVDRIGGIELAMEITGLAKPTLYSLTANRKIPHLKRNKRIYFERNALLEWLRSGRRKTQAEIAESVAA